MRILVMGSGGVGGYFGGHLARARHDVTFVARGDHLAALQTKGLRVEGVDGEFSVSARAVDSIPDGFGPVDLVLFTVKSYDTAPAAELIGPAVGPNTKILTLQNGVENADELARRFGVDRVLVGAARIEATIAAPGLIVQSGQPRWIEFGELAGGITSAAELLLAAFQTAGIQAKLTDNARRTLWDKFLFLGPIAGLTTLADATVGQVRGPALRETFAAAVGEVAAVAQAHGVDLGADAVERVLAISDALHADMKTSMQRDRERGRRIEVEALNGSVVRLGAAKGVPTPINRCIYGCLSVGA